jgi:putative membrane protein
MHIGKSYGVFEFVRWTRRKAGIVAAIALVPVALYQLAGWHWLAIPWPVLALLGTAASFIVGFKNAHTYGRTVEAQQVWSAITALSRYWGLVCRDFVSSGAAQKDLIYRHLAWLTALRYELRSPRVWESATRRHNFDYQRQAYDVPEHRVALDCALQPYLAPQALAELMRRSRIAGDLMSRQSLAIRDLYASGEIPVLHHTEMQKTLKDLLDQYARAERIKNFPYPRQYAIVHSILVWLFAVLLPFGVVREFDRLADGTGSPVAWLAVPFSMLVAWVYVALDQVGESTENPFEGGANDVPISHICGGLENELRDLIGDTDVSSSPPPGHNIVM